LETNPVFAPAYREERLYETIDFVNKWYVGFTRAEHALYVFSKKEKGDIITEKKGLVLYQVAKQITDTLKEELSSVHWTEDQLVETMTVGALPDKPQGKKEEERNDTISLPYYSKSFKDTSLRLRLKAQSSDQQRWGSTLHQLLQFIVTADDLEKALVKTIRMGMILPEKVDEARNEMLKILSHPQAKTWFDGSYSAVWNERSIITHKKKKSKQNAIYRPDRLLVKDNTIVVIDYKFGEKHDSYQRQIKNYMQLLADMGRWNNIVGYLYYHKTGKVELVSI
jgi:ATP-dependent exoDNAse (exonuclease V) beta subunit